jgi:hypothetical protein
MAQLASPSPLSCVAQLSAHRDPARLQARSKQAVEHAPTSLTWFDPVARIRPDKIQTRPKSEFIPVKPIHLNQVFPSFDFSLSAMIQNRFRDRLVRIPTPLRVGIKTPINSVVFCLDFRS